MNTINTEIEKTILHLVNQNSGGIKFEILMQKLQNALGCYGYFDKQYIKSVIEHIPDLKILEYKSKYFKAINYFIYM